MKVEQRIENIEQQMLFQNQKIQRTNKRLKVGLTMMAVVVCAVMTMAATGEKRGDFDILTARYINLKNDTGDYVVRLRANPDGDGEISTHSARGNELVVLTATVDGNGKLTTYHPDGKTLVKLTGTVKGGMIKTYQPSGKELVDLSSNDNGALVYLYNKTGKGIVHMGADERGNGVVRAYNRKGEGQVIKRAPR